MNAQRAAFIAAGILLSAFASYKHFIGIPYQTDITGAATRLVGALFVVTAFVERSTAVLNSIWYGEAVRAARTREVLERIAWMSVTPVRRDPPASLIEAADALASIEAEQDKTRSVAAFILALFVSAVGMRTLEALLVLPDPVHSAGSWPLHCGLFHAAHIVVTAGLIAGGTAGIHAIIELLTEYVRHAKAKLTTIPSPVA